MSVDHLAYEWWVADDGWLWVRHRCGEKVEEWHPPSPWRVTEEGGVTPSFDCRRCGAHSILRAADRVLAPVDNQREEAP